MRRMTMMQNGIDRALDCCDFRRVFAAVPMADVDDLVLPKSERWLGSVDGEWNEPVALASLRRLIPHPIGFDRVGGPQDHDHVGLLEGFRDRTRISFAAFDQRIPPDGEAGMFERRGEAMGIVAVRPRVAQEKRYSLVGCA